MNEVCRHSCGAEGEAPRVFPIDEKEAPEGKLSSFIHQFMRTVLLSGSSSLQGKIMAREMMEPTPALQIIVQEIIRPRQEQLMGIIRAILGDTADDALLRRCCFSIVGQCLYYRFARVVAQELQPNLDFNEKTVDGIAQHITLFTLQALQGYCAGSIIMPKGKKLIGVLVALGIVAVGFAADEPACRLGEKSRRKVSRSCVSRGQRRAGCAGSGCR